MSRLTKLVTVGDEVKIRGSRCSTCHHATVPSRRICPQCGAEAMQEAGFGATGSILSSVVLNVSTLGHEAPYRVALVRLAEGPTVFARVTDVSEAEGTVYLRGQPDADEYWFSGGAVNGKHMART
ncbi:MAG: Zn-ribbon domain-containing OB-fold protein [Candidatus Dormibacteria bacterium]